MFISFYFQAQPAANTLVRLSALNVGSLYPFVLLQLGQDYFFYGMHT